MSKTDAWQPITSIFGSHAINTDTFTPPSVTLTFTLTSGKYIVLLYYYIIIYYIYIWTILSGVQQQGPNLMHSWARVLVVAVCRLGDEGANSSLAT